jgi:putative endonuclease
MGKGGAMEKSYVVYMLTNRNNTVIYTGITNDIVRRLEEHRQKEVPSFTARYNVGKLVYYELFPTSYDAIQREKQIKAGSRAKKVGLIESLNPGWEDLADKL